MGHPFETTSFKTIGACIEVKRQLGSHCMEVNVQRALTRALPKHGLDYLREAEIPIFFDGVEITRRRVDFVVWDDAATLLLEIKSAKVVRPEDIEQCLLYLLNGNFSVCLLINFGQTPLYKKRFVHTPTGPALYGPHGR